MVPHVLYRRLHRKVFAALHAGALMPYKNYQDKLAYMARRYATQDKEAARQKRRAFYLANRERICAKQRAYTQANEDKVRASARNRTAWQSETARRARLDYYREYAQKHKVRQLNSARRRRGLPLATREAPARCECCGQPPQKRALALDHCHATGAFRGWVCSRCNLGLGMLGDTLEALQRACVYLSRCPV